jgi:hypothetical protein
MPPERMHAADSFDGRHARVAADQHAPFLRSSRVIGLAAAPVRRNRQFSARDHYIWTLLARPLKLLEAQQANI